MNLVLHNKAAGEVVAGNTFSDPYYKDPQFDYILRRFDFAVSNPPFSLKNWTDGLQEYGRFDGYGDRPPDKNGDYAWLMHILKSLKSTGKAAVILPHGVLFRGNAEATIRRSIIDKGYIKGIIGLPANLFYGTGIPACILVIDKETAALRAGSSSRYKGLDADALQETAARETAEGKGIFMIDASHGYIKDGNKNRLREEDIYRIVTTFNQQITTDPKYARFVPNAEIKAKNDYNLNITRYIDSSVPEDQQDIDAHLHGGIPAADIDSMSNYWVLFPRLEAKLFSVLREGYYQLTIPKEDIRNTIYTDEEFSAYAERIDMAFDAWREKVDEGLRSIDESVDVDEFIVTLSELLIAEFADLELVDKYDVYEVLLSYWTDTMSDDVFVLKYYGYEAGREWENIVEITENKKGEKKEKIKGWEGKLIPKALVEHMFFAEERKAIDAAQAVADETQSRLDELTEEQTGDEGYLRDYLNDKDKVDGKQVAARLKALKKARTDSEEASVLAAYAELADRLKRQNKIIKELNAALDIALKEKYPELTDEEIKELLVNRKWYYSLFDGIKALYVTASHSMANRITELVERYENTLPQLEQEVANYEAKVRAHLERMGFPW